MITIYILTSEFGSSRKCDRNNLQWLRHKDRVNGAVFVSPYAENDYFKEQFVLPLLDKDGYIEEKSFDVPQITLDGLSYCIKKWHKNQYEESFTKNNIIMLHVNELVVGDWVLDGNAYAQVTSITCDGNIETTHNEHSNIELIEPIQLTPEILKKNGFAEWSDKCYRWEYADGIYINADFTEEEPWAHISNRCYSATPVCRYVHEFQHALKLCGIYKEIVL